MSAVTLRLIARGLLGPAYMAAFALVLGSYTEVGGGFSAGIVAGSVVALQYVAFGFDRAEELLPVRLFGPLAFVGLLLVLGVVFVPVLLGDAMLSHYPRPGDPLHTFGSLELHTATVFETGVFLLVQGFMVDVLRWVARLVLGRRDTADGADQNTAGESAALAGEGRGE